MTLLSLGIALWGASCVIHRLGQIWVEAQKIKLHRNRHE